MKKIEIDIKKHISEIIDDSAYWINGIIEMEESERIDIWCKMHNKSKPWGYKLDTEKLDKLGCPKEKITLDIYK